LFSFLQLFCGIGFGVFLIAILAYGKFEVLPFFVGL